MGVLFLSGAIKTLCYLSVKGESNGPDLVNNVGDVEDEDWCMSFQYLMFVVN